MVQGAEPYAHRITETMNPRPLELLRRYNYPCGSVPVSLYLWREDLYSKAKRRAMDRTTAQCIVAFNVLWM
jgi:hypothetical protein